MIPKGEKKKGNDGFMGRPSQHWMTLDDGKHPSKCKWFNFSIFAKFILALIVLSSIIKKEDIVRKMAPLAILL